VKEIHCLFTNVRLIVNSGSLCQCAFKHFIHLLIQQLFRHQYFTGWLVLWLKSNN